MAHDFIDLGGSSLRLNDFHIWTLRHFLIETIASIPPEHLESEIETLSELRQFIEGWEWIGPGLVVGCDFGPYTSSPQRFALLDHVFARTIERLRDFGEVIPHEYLEQHVNCPAAYYVDSQPVEVFATILAKLSDLIPKTTGGITRTASEGSGKASQAE